ncbi:MAG: hypothetical protein IKR59_06120 [Lachnospiraceae bacterium]|nr:hypothetical protein [Lachnospiraceae bacterium]
MISNADGALKLSHETVSMTASIARIRDVSITLEDTTGTPAEGFRKVKTTLSRSVVSVRGLLGTLSNFDMIVIPANLVNIDGISQDTEYTIDLADLLPQGLTVAEGSSAVTVYVTVEALVGAEYAYNTSNIVLTGEDELYLYSFETDTIPIRVRGFQEDLDLLNVNASVAATADVSNLRPGTHTVKVAISGPIGYYYDNTDSLTVRVSVKINEAMTTTTEEETTESESEGESSSGETEESSGSETETETDTETDTETGGGIEDTEPTSETGQEKEQEGEPEELQAEDQH